jgi:hypothetical protein
MKYSDESYNLRIELDTKNCELSPREIERIEGLLDPLRKPLEKFPVSSLYLTIEHHQRSAQYRVRAALRLPGRGLATGDIDEALHPAVQRCARKLLHNLAAYEAELDNAEDRTKHIKGTRHDLEANRPVDTKAVERAVRDGNYVDFRKLLFPFEESVRTRAGRWIQRYPDLQAELNEKLSLADVVEELFLTAFERFDDRPQNVPFEHWLEGLIDPAVKMLANSTAEELDNISYLRTWQEIEKS